MPNEKHEVLEPTIVTRRQIAQVGELECLAQWMDTIFEIPGTGIRFGWDAIIGLLPGIGDTITALLSVYILAVASRYGLRRITLLRMALNIAIEVVVGAVPFFGDLFDVAWKANVKNVALLKRHLAASPSDSGRARRSDWIFVTAASLAIFIVLLAGLALVWLLFLAFFRLLFPRA